MTKTKDLSSDLWQLKVAQISTLRNYNTIKIQGSSTRAGSLIKLCKKETDLHNNLSEFQQLIIILNATLDLDQQGFTRHQAEHRTPCYSSLEFWSN